MKNILSYIAGTEFSGAEILAWAQLQVKNGTSHAKQGEYILRHYFNLDTAGRYHISTSHIGTACGEIIKHIYITKV